MFDIHGEYVRNLQGQVGVAKAMLLERTIILFCPFGLRHVFRKHVIHHHHRSRTLKDR